jgi:serine/threonine-protein kinase
LTQADQVGKKTVPNPQPRSAFEAGESYAGYEIIRRLTDEPSPLYQVRTSQGEELALQVVWPGSSAAAQRHPLHVLRIVGKVHHPHLSPVLDVAQSAGLLYCTTRLPAGGFLADRAGAPLPPVEDAARLVERIARAVHTLHGQRILHRNLSPYSIGLGADGSPFVMDYTLAMLDWTEADYLELQGQVIGRPAYIAPEQAFARRTEIGPATDVYSLGAVLYELLTGRPPVQAADGLALLGKLAREDAAPPQQLRPEIPGDLETICLRCLCKRAADRHATALDLANELRRFLKMDLPPPPQRASWWSRLLSWIRTRGKGPGS